MRKQHRGLQLCLVALLLIPVAFIQTRVDHQRSRIGLTKKGIEAGWQLPVEMLMASLAGFREPVASLLWVKCDDYFHTGKFEEVVPLMKVITKLDPHMVDVYATGAWHLDYNFVDKNEVADRRLIPSALEFLEDGIKNNSRIFDLYFEMAFTHQMVKIRNMPASIYWLKQTLGKRTSDGDPTPRYVIHSLAHAYEMNGDIENCLKTWQESIAFAKQETARLKKHPSELSKKAFNPLGENVPEDIAAWDLDVSTRNYERVKTAQLLRAHLSTDRPVHANMKVSVRRIKPRMLLVEGSMNITDLTRLDVYLRDADWPERAKQDFGWRLDNQTWFQDTVMVDKGKFQLKIDLTDGERFYPLKGDNYVVTVELNPRFEPAEAQAQIGWSGEGLADQPCLVKVPGDPKQDILPMRMLRWEKTLQRSEIE